MNGHMNPSQHTSLNCSLWECYMRMNKLLSPLSHGILGYVRYSRLASTQIHRECFVFHVRRYRAGFSTIGFVKQQRASRMCVVS